MDGYETDFNGIFHIGNNSVLPAPLKIFPNSTVQNGPDVVALYLEMITISSNTTATTTNLINALAYSGNSTQPSAMMTTLGITVCTNENVNGLVTSQSIQENDVNMKVKRQLQE